MDQLVERQLEKTRLFKEVNLEFIKDILQHAQLKNLNQGEILIQAGEKNQYLYILLSGRLAIHLEMNLSPVAILGPGEIVGELSLIDGEGTTAFVVADDDCRILQMDEASLWSLVSSSPTIARNFLSILARRLRHLTRQQLQREYAHYAVIDALTGMYNRRWMDAMLVREMERSQRSELPLTVLLLGIDGLETYREAHGRLMGDCVLHSVAALLRDHLRAREMMARYREEEFLVILSETDLKQAGQVAERLLEVICHAPVRSFEQTELPPVTVSAGIAQIQREDTLKTLMDRCDAALTEAQNQGGNRVVLQ